MTLYLLEPNDYVRPAQGSATGFFSLAALRAAVYATVPASIHAVEVEGGPMLQANEGWVQFDLAHITHSRKLKEHRP